MTIIDLTPEYEELYFNCLIGDERRLSDAGDYKRRWYEAMRPRGLRVKLALDGGGKPAGMVQYLPVEESTVSGRDLFSLLCIWVVKDRKVRGNFRKQGFGTALLEAFEQDARSSGRKGVTAWGLSIPVFMQAVWFAKHGYVEVERQGIQVLLWKSWEPDVPMPSWKPRLKQPEPVSGKTAVTCYCCGWCPEVNKAFTRAKRAAAAYGGNVDFTEIDTTDRAVFNEWGISDAVFVGSREIRLGPAPSYRKILKAVRKNVKQAGKEKT